MTDLADTLGRADGDECCCSCLRPFTKGEPYHYANVTDDGVDMIGDVVCLDCAWRDRG